MFHPTEALALARVRQQDIARELRRPGRALVLDLAPGHGYRRRPRDLRRIGRLGRLLPAGRRRPASTRGA